ncbi:MAG TPA: hypothetical protein VMM82_15510 [Spirochaetia bacterium]|nr:hypothetical protein [Spirochaetia bacterium]
MSINLDNFAAAQQEAIADFKFDIKGPPNPPSLSELKSRLSAAQSKLPPVYREALCAPFLKVVGGLSDSDFASIVSNPNTSSFFFDFAQAILQHAESFEPQATGAFQEVVADLYDGFLSHEDRANIKLPDRDTITPIVKWGNPEDGPYTITIESARQLGVECAIVNLPPAIARGVLVAWSSLAHETAGHDVAHADIGLVPEMKQTVRNAILTSKKIGNATIRNTLATYWSNCMDETSADIMGILNMGPAPAIGMIPFFRSFLAQYGQPPRLRNAGPADDPHPADILRVMLGSAAVKLLSFADAADWAAAILNEGLKDLTTIYLNGSSGSPGVQVDAASAQASADIVAATLVTAPFETLRHHCLKEIQDWQQSDEQIAQSLRAVLRKQGAATQEELKGAYAAHLVAAAVYEALETPQAIAPLFQSMVSILKQMHDANAAWGPLYVMHPGNIVKDRAFRLVR